MGKDENGRTLHNVKLVSTFMKSALHLHEIYSEEEFGKVALELVSAEAQVDGVSEDDTLYFSSNRLPLYESEDARVVLRKRIYDELTSMRRPDDDDKITLGIGGALPQTELRKEKTAFIVIGLPASGKSEIARKISDDFGAMILDSDFAKRKIPEYNVDFGASLVKKESSSIVFGGFKGHEKEPSLFSYAVSSGINMVIPKVGDDEEKIFSFAEGLNKGTPKNKPEYQVHLILVRLDREKATQRAIERYRRTKRYVPVSLIYDVYSNNPTITFYDMMILEHYKNVFASFTMISTDVPLGNDADVLYASSQSPFRK